MADVQNLSLVTSPSGETAFERPRGISRIEVREGFAQVQVEGLHAPVTETRLGILDNIAEGGVSIDFVKLTPTGFTFICAQENSGKVAGVLTPLSVKFDILEGRSIVLVHAVNLRDDEGLIAKIVQAAIHANTHVDHIGDMHDRLLLVVRATDVSKLVTNIEALSYPVPSLSVPHRASTYEPKLPKNRGIKVMKFGGTSVATAAARMQSAMRVVSAKEQGFLPVVVVSAIGRRGDPYATDTLLGLLREIDPNVTPDARESDLMIACGEIMSAVIFAHLLKTLGHSASAFRGGQAGIRTDGTYGNARVVGINPVSLFKTLEEGRIPVVCGFQGVFVAGDGTPGGELTTLGRGGSDTTASAVGAAVAAHAVEIFTDVEGVKTADPDFVKEAPTLRKVTYDEVAEIAHLGAKVVHPRAAEIAMNFDIPLWVKSTFSDDEGTEIVSRDKFPGRRVTGVTHTGKLVYLQFRLDAVPDEESSMLKSRIFDALARFNVNLFMVNVSPTGAGFAVPRDQYPIVRDVFDGLVIPVEGKRSVYLFQIGKPSPEVETQADLLASLGELRRISIELTEGCTMVSVVGHDYMPQPGVFHRMLFTLNEAGIPVLQTTDSDYSLSCLIPESELRRAVRQLHDAFELTGAK
jgi:aspartate kinase